MLIRTIVSTCHLVLLLLAVQRWMLAKLSAWEDANKALTESERAFARFSQFFINYWYVIACIWLVGSLMGFIIAARRSNRKLETWV